MLRASLLLLLVYSMFRASASLRSIVRVSRYSQQHAVYGGGPVRGDRLPRLLEIIETQDRGLQTNRQAEIKEIIDSIAQQNADFVARGKQMFSKVDGRWRLVYTTEKETLFFARSGLFGSKCSGIYQCIDTEAKSINNLIEFEGGKSFSVLGQIEQSKDASCRVNFRFTKAAIRLPFEISVPPVGAGWFDNVYMNDKYRLSRDSRGDYLVSIRS